ncbi:MAG: hypothetical protein QMD99_25985 [Rhizobiaceae bacterium]|nr:hypothetical protein [Rhizobiaceae bacterium]
MVGVWPPAGGTIRLDGAELSQWVPGALGRSIGYLPQGVELFDGTIAENISRFEEDPDPVAIIEAAKQAGVHHIILTMPDGYDTRIGAAGHPVGRSAPAHRLGAGALWCLRTHENGSEPLRPISRCPRVRGGCAPKPLAISEALARVKNSGSLY